MGMERAYVLRYGNNATATTSSLKSLKTLIKILKSDCLVWARYNLRCLVELPRWNENIIVCLQCLCELHEVYVKNYRYQYLIANINMKEIFSKLKWHDCRCYLGMYWISVINLTGRIFTAIILSKCSMFPWYFWNVCNHST